MPSSVDGAILAVARRIDRLGGSRRPFGFSDGRERPVRNVEWRVRGVEKFHTIAKGAICFGMGGGKRWLCRALNRLNDDGTSHAQLIGQPQSNRMCRMETVSSILAGGFVAAGIAFSASPVQAFLILVGPENFQGTGLGAVNAILAISSPGGSSIESGSVSFNGTMDVRTGDTLNQGGSPSIDQRTKFEETARSLGCDEDEVAFKAKLAVIARQKAKEAPEPPKGPRTKKPRS